MSDEWVRRLAEIPTPVLSDVMRGKGLDPCTMHSSMKPVRAGAGVCAPALTARTHAGATHVCGLAQAQARPDGLVRGDESGVEIIPEAEAFHAREGRILEFLRAGLPLGEACHRAAAS